MNTDQDQAPEGMPAQDTNPAEGYVPPPSKTSTDEVTGGEATPIAQEVQSSTNPNTKQEFETFSGEFTAGPEHRATAIPFVPLPGLARDKLEKMANDPRLDDTSSDSARKYHQVILGSMDLTTNAGAYTETLRRSSAGYLQYLQTPRTKVGFSAPKAAEKEGVKLTGDAALLRVRSIMGLGGLLTIPLFHSGFHITIRTPDDSTLIELRRRMEDDKIAIGRQTHGLIFSNQSVYSTGWVLDLILDHVQETSLKDGTIERMRQKIKTTDINIMIWGLACGVWPRGFDYYRPVLDDKGIDSKELLSGKVNVAKLLWVDNNSFSEFQKTHMADRTPGRITDEMIDRYLAEFPYNAGRGIDIIPAENGEESRLRMVFKTPSIERYIGSGQRWITSLRSIVENSFNEEDPVRRSAAIVNHARATTMRQYVHFVDTVIADGDEITDIETIERLMSSFSEDEDIRKKFFEEISKFTDDVTGAVIAIPEGKEREKTLPRFPHLIPVDPLSTFFILLMQRLSQLEKR